LLDWKAMGLIIDKDYHRDKSATGKPSYDGILLFKMCLLHNWYGLSDYEVEDRINDSISFSYFCGLTCIIHEKTMAVCIKYWLLDNYINII
jgi:IS5 family transposase